ncbi:MAG: hypothetical protein ACK4UK_04325 [Flavobacterium sp.]
MNQRFFSLLFLFFLFSCQLFESKEVKEEQLLKERLEDINWQEVTQYPTLPACDSLLNKQERKDCFFQSLTAWLQQQLELSPLPMDVAVQDTLPVKVTLRHDATMLFELQFPSDVTYNTKKVDSLLQSRWSAIPEMVPALKQDIPVTTQFMVQVILTQQPTQ